MPASREVAPPRVSVVIPVRDRRALLGECLEALGAQTMRDFEVIVVDDGSRDGSGEAAGARTIGGRPVRVIRLPEECTAVPPSGAASGATVRRGAVAARVAGVAASHGEIVAFTDSDCAPQPDWLRLAVAAIDAGADVVNGRTRPARPVRPLERSMGSGGEGLYPTCNIVYRRAAYDAAGGFDPSAADMLGFRRTGRARGLGFGEDTLLAWRVRRNGVAIHEPRAVVDHHVFGRDVADSLGRAWMMGAFPALVRAVPELRDTLLRHRVQIGDRSRLACYAAAAAVLSGRRRTAALLAFGHGAACVRAMRRSGSDWGDAVAGGSLEAAIDAVTAGALLVGSVRARTVVL